MTKLNSNFNLGNVVFIVENLPIPPREKQSKVDHKINGKSTSSMKLRKLELDEEKGLVIINKGLNSKNQTTVDSLSAKAFDDSNFSIYFTEVDAYKAAIEKVTKEVRRANDLEDKFERKIKKVEEELEEAKEELRLAKIIVSSINDNKDILEDKLETILLGSKSKKEEEVFEEIV